MKTMKMVCAAVFCISVTTLSAGCVGTETDALTEEYEDAQGGDENVAEATAAITYNAWNYTCAQSLTIRPAPGASTAYCSVGKYTLAYAYWPPSGEWADVYVPTCGVRGWALKSYISTNCN